MNPRNDCPEAFNSSRFAIASTKSLRSRHGFVSGAFQILRRTGSSDRTVLPIAPSRFHGTIGTTYADSKPEAPFTVHAPEGAPNVLVVLLDDGLRPVRHLWRPDPHANARPPSLGRSALHPLSRHRALLSHACGAAHRPQSPRRRHGHHHQSGARIFPATTAPSPKAPRWSLRCCAKRLCHRGLRQVAPDPREREHAHGPFDHWPTHQGFDYYYGFLDGETNQWHPELTLGTEPVEMVPPPGREADYTLNEDLADKAVTWIKAEKSLAPDKPFFVYYAPGASHAPLQAPEAWIDKFKGQFDMGWDRYREIVLERQKEARRRPGRIQSSLRDPPPFPHGTRSRPTRKQSRRG